MASIVLVHGINHAQSGPELVLEKWLPALQSGIHIAAMRGSIPCERLPTKDDVEPLFWGDLFRDDRQQGLDIPPLDAQHLTEPEDRELLSILLQHAERLEGVQESASSLGLHDGVRTALNRLASTAFFRGLYRREPIRNLVWFIKLVNQYMYDTSAYLQVQARAERTITEDTTLVIGHSLGSVIAYEALCRDPKNVVTLITLGSPLGMPTIVYDRLRSEWVATERGRVRQRPGVRHWHNVSGSRDVVAVTPNLRDLFDEPDVVDTIINVGPEGSVNLLALHDVVAHLTHETVGTAAWRAWHGTSD